MAREAAHLFVVVGQLCNTGSPLAVLTLITCPHQLGAGGLGVVVCMVGIHRIFNEAHLPFFVGIERCALIQLTLAPLEPQPAVLSPQQTHIHSTGPGGWATGTQGGIFLRGAMAVGTVNFDRRCHFSINVAIAVHILREVAVHAMHPDIDVDR